MALQILAEKTGGRTIVHRFPRYQAHDFSCALKKSGFLASLFGHPNHGYPMPVYEIGEGGFGFTSPASLKTEEEFDFWIMYFFLQSHVEGRVKIRCCLESRANPQYPFRVGAQFLDVRGDGIARLRTLFQSPTFQRRMRKSTFLPAGRNG